jgi:soluble lytic murein transglycosylase-like protein
LGKVNGRSAGVPSEMDQLIRAVSRGFVVVVAVVALAALAAFVIDLSRVRRDVAVASTEVTTPRAADRVIARRSAEGSRSVAESAVVAAASEVAALAPAPIVVSELQQRYEPVARAAAARYDIDPNVFVRQITKESHWDPTAVSPAGARGIAQFMPSTAAWLGVDPFDPITALDAAAKLDRDNLDAFDGDYAMMLAAYNAGRGSVRRYGGIPPFAETLNYVRLILGTEPL